tara:strand:+ start:3652 stop:4194 length:543 start_codon:yes stop_codon:yes gene_type:complete
MKLGLLILIITGFIVINIYHDGKYIKMLKEWKKYYQMAFYAFLGLSLFIFIKKNPSDGKDLLSHAHSFVKFMPIDKDSSDMLSPLLKISSQGMGVGYSPQFNRMMNSGTSSSNKRSVSETKKKFVAAQQNWKCAGCNCQLPAWFEVDHKIRLDRGGDNHISNLEALCRDCHGKKTAMESI